VDAHVGLQAVSAAEDLEVLPDRGDEPVCLELRRPELEDQRSQLGLRVPGQRPDAVDLELGVDPAQSPGRRDRPRRVAAVRDLIYLLQDRLRA